jgi:hypothetical protein
MAIWDGGAFIGGARPGLTRSDQTVTKNGARCVRVGTAVPVAAGLGPVQT